MPATFLVMPVKSFPEIPVYEINSASTLIVPDVGNPVTPDSVMEVPDPPVPLLSSSNAPLRVLTTPLAPPHEDVPHP